MAGPFLRFRGNGPVPGQPAGNPGDGDAGLEWLPVETPPSMADDPAMAALAPLAVVSPAQSANAPPAFDRTLPGDAEPGFILLPERDPDLSHLLAGHSVHDLAAARAGSILADASAYGRGPAALWMRIANSRDALSDSIAASWQREGEFGNLFNLLPFALAAGIATYFTLPAEPILAVLVLSFISCLAITIRIRGRGAGYLLACGLAVFFAGMVVASLEARRAAFPIPVSEITGRIEGIVLEADRNRNGSARYLIRPVAIEGLAPDQLPPSIRLSASSRHEALAPGDPIAGLARLSPVSGPAFPGGYDFAFHARFEGLALSGFFMGKPSTGPPVEPLRMEHFNLTIGKLRQAIGERIRTGLPGEPGEVAVALINGDQSGISEETQESLRRSGLAHVLSISGLHMVLVTLTVVGALRFLMVLVPGLAERHNIRKWAMAAGLVSATTYLLISGMQVATQRAWLMMAVMLFSALVDRRALTMRNVSIAALAILILEPTSLFSPGFQMSFAATAALVAAYRDWSARRFHDDTASATIAASMVVTGQGLLPRVLRHLGAIAFTSLVAGTATAIFSAWHFHRVAPMGLVANLAAMPVVSILVMPMALASALLMPFGMEFIALKPLGWSISAMVAISDAVNRLGLDFETGLRPSSLVLSGTVLLAILCVFQTRLRWLALVPALVFLGSVLLPRAVPDLLISQDGRAIAALAPDSKGRIRLSLPFPRRGEFQTQIWQRAFTPGLEPVALETVHACDRDRCDFDIERRRVAIVFDPERIAQACAEADILLAPRLWWARCRGQAAPRARLIITRTDLENRGSHAVSLADTGTVGEYNVVTAIDPAALSRIWNARIELPAGRKAGVAGKVEEAAGVSVTPARPR